MSKRMLASSLLAVALLVGSIVPANAAVVPLTTTNASGVVTPTGNAVPTPGLGSFTYAQTYSAPTGLIPTTSFGFYDDFVFDMPASLANTIASTISLSNLLGHDCDIAGYAVGGESLCAGGARLHGGKRRRKLYRRAQCNTGSVVATFC